MNTESSKSEISKQETIPISKKRGLFSRLFHKKEKFSFNEQKPNTPIKEDPHPLDIVHNQEKELQITNNETSRLKEESFENNLAKHKSTENIEEISYGTNSNQNKENEFNINELRKALGLIQETTEKDLQIKKFKEALFDKESSEEDMITDLDLEEKLNSRLSLTPEELIKNINLLINLDIKVSEKNKLNFSNNKNASSLRELKEITKDMDQKLFSQKVSKTNNEIADWINEKLNEPKLAEIIKKCKTPKQIYLVLLELTKKQELEELKIQTDEKEILDIKEVRKRKSDLEKLEKDYKEKLNSVEIKQKELTEEQKTLTSEDEKVRLLKQQYEESIKNQNTKIEKIKQELTAHTEEYKQKLSQEFNNNKIELEKEFNLKKQKLDVNMRIFEKQKIQMENLYHTKLKELKSEEEKLISIQKDIKEQESILINKSTEIKNKLVELKDNLIESKKLDSEIKIDIEEKKKLLFDIRQKEIELRYKKEEIERQGFQKYIDEQLKILNHPTVPKIVSEVRPRDSVELYNLVNDCRTMINVGNLEQAKIIYSGIRKDFTRTTIPEQDREILFNAIKELYTDIKLSLV